MFRRSVVLTAVVALAFGARAQADVIFQPNGNNSVQIAGFQGFDPSPGNVLNVGAAQAIANFLSSGSTQFTAFGQSNLITALTSGGPVGFGNNFTFVFGTTENVTGVTGAIGATSSTAAFQFNPSGPVNYVQVFANSAPNNLAGTGFNTGTLVLSAHISTNASFTTTVTSGTSVPLDGFGSNNYTNNNTVGTSGDAGNVKAIIDSFNSNFFVLPAGQTLVGAQINFGNLGLATAFSSVDPSAAFLTGTTTTAVGGSPVTAGAGLGSANGGLLNIGGLNGGSGNGQSVQVQQDANFTFSPLTTTTTVPEPTSLVVFGAVMGVAGVVYRKRRNVKKDSVVA